MSTPLVIENGASSVRLPWDESWAGRTLSSVLASHGAALNTRCGGRGWCRGCLVDLREGMVLGPTGPVLAPATLRSCLCRMPSVGPVRVRLHQRAVLARTHSVVGSFSVDAPCEPMPELSVVPGSADTGFAVDLGTTTVVVALVDLGSGEVLSRAGGYNAQLRFGDNVLTRIEAAADPVVRAELRRVVVKETLDPLLREAALKAGRHLGRVKRGVIAGNTTMLHLLLGMDPTSLGRAPFTPAFLQSRVVGAQELGLATETDNSAGNEREALPVNAEVRLMPGYSAFVGADIAAGIWATGMLFDAKPSVLVDIGTNGEMALHAEGVLHVCATAAGPAFEGSGLGCGTRAHEGAVWKVGQSSGTGQWDLQVLGGVPQEAAEGLCGTAYVDFMAVGRRCGLLSARGRLEDAALQALPAEAITGTVHGRALALLAGTRLMVSEQDIALLLQAKAALGAGLSVLLACAGLRPSDVGTLYLAGGFGLHIDLANALAIGLFPGFTAEQVKVVGNTSLAGAIMALVDRRVVTSIEAARERVRVVELNAHPEFEDLFIDNLSL